MKARGVALISPNTLFNKSIKSVAQFRQTGKPPGHYWETARTLLEDLKLVYKENY